MSRMKCLYFSHGIIVILVIPASRMNIIFLQKFRIIVEHMDAFKDQAKKVVWHISSKYSEEMAKKSEVVSSS